MPLHEGVRRPFLSSPPFEGPILASSRFDQEAFQDANLIRQALTRAQRAEKQLDVERSLKLAALLLLPALFFAGIFVCYEVLVITDHIRNFGFGIGMLVGIPLACAMMLTEIYKDVAAKIQKHCGRNIWEG